MTKEEAQFYRIEQFIHHEMQGEEKDLFEKELSENSALQDKVDAHRVAEELVIEHRLLQVKEILLQEKINASKRSLFKKILLATLVLGGFLVLITFFLSRKNQITPAPVAPQIHHPVSKNNFPINPPVSAEIIISPVLKTKENILIEKRMPATTTKKDSVFSNVLSQAAVSTELKITPLTLQSEATTTVPPKTNKVPCTSVHIVFRTLIEGACKGNSNGTIAVRDLKGGQAPYSISLFNEQEDEVAKEAVPSGTYTLVIKDHNNCRQTATDVFVPQKHCMTEDSFNPFTGEQWNIPVSGLDGTLEIHDPSGKIYYEKNIPSGTKDHWNGQSLGGELKTGYFIFMIRYTDGSLEQGSITIVQ